MDLDLGKTLVLIVSLSSLVLSANNALASTDSPRRSLRTHPQPQARPDISKLCEPTTNPALCAQTISAAIGGPDLDPYKALEAAILATQKQVTRTAGIITSLLANPSNSKQLRDSLSTCSKLYDGDMVDSIKDSLKEVEQRNAGEARFKFSAVLSFQATCNDEFSGPSPFANDSDAVYQLGANCLDIMKTLEDDAIRKGAASNPVPVLSPPDPCQNVIGSCDLD